MSILINIFTSYIAYLLAAQPSDKSTGTHSFGLFILSTCHYTYSQLLVLDSSPALYNALVSSVNNCLAINPYSFH